MIHGRVGVLLKDYELNGCRCAYESEPILNCWYWTSESYAHTYVRHKQYLDERLKKIISLGEFAHARRVRIVLQFRAYVATLLTTQSLPITMYHLAYRRHRNNSS